MEFIKLAAASILFNALNQTGQRLPRPESSQVNMFKEPGNPWEKFHSLVDMVDVFKRYLSPDYIASNQYSPRTGIISRY